MTKRTKTASGLSITSIDILIRFGHTPVECHVSNDHKIHNREVCFNFCDIFTGSFKNERQRGRSLILVPIKKQVTIERTVSRHVGSLE